MIIRRRSEVGKSSRYLCFKVKKFRFDCILGSQGVFIDNLLRSPLTIWTKAALGNYRMNL